MTSLNISSSARPAIWVKKFHSSASSFYSNVSNNIWRCAIFRRVISTRFARLTTFRIARERVKFDSISATGFAFCKTTVTRTTP
ncbi:hypothetical protein GQ55_3G114700 [Panicum hallii var. hallii]|uniref:Uncharacterized protein n=1 Tax=Panicum hallii var. hallii TaxID=1504633 RepID=A0A2T7E8B9_9POAL|nr:hypothetical protein GQ55_3G114700 [Panicum hallii var. hallii]